MQKLVFRSALGPNQISFSHSQGQKHALPHCNIVIWFTSINRHNRQPSSTRVAGGQASRPLCAGDACAFERAVDPLNRGGVNPKPSSNLADALSAPWLVQGLTDSFF
jgi:hypothetical protein